MDIDVRCEIKTTVCRHSVSNASEAQALFDRIGQQAQIQNYRAMIVIETTTNAESILWRDQNTPYFGKDVTVLDNTFTRDRSDELTRILGSEQYVAVYARAFDAGLFASLAGTVRQGGVLIWISRPLDQWANHSLYGRRLLSLLNVVTSSTMLTTPSPQAATMHTAGVIEQDKLLATLYEVCSTDGNAVAVLAGKRGRGKSTLLGRLVSKLSPSGKQILITAPYRGAIRNVSKSVSGSELPFVAVDRVLDHSADILLVDEAANVPLDLLSQWVMHFPKVVLATTVEGYESAGRGFTIRFSRWLDEHRPGWHRLEPVHPWRWDPGDPLEWFVDRLLLSTDAAALPPPEAFSEAPTFLHISQQQLASDDALLASIYQLLREHHYQTSVLDLQHLLDAENLLVFVAMVSGQCIAASLIAIEGELDLSLHEAIVAKERRIAHQLLPQLLAQTANQVTALNARYARVMRIAVAPAWRRRKIASGLLTFIERTLIGSVEVIGASFADTSVANAFWQDQRYLIVHQGFRPNPRSGARSLAVLKALDSNYEALLQSVHRLYRDNHHATVGDSLEQNDDPHLSDEAILGRLIRGERNVHDTLGALRRYVKQTPDNANWLEQLYERLGCEETDSRRVREKKLRRWLGRQTTNESASYRAHE